jgi:hypothetical protein
VITLIVCLIAGLIFYSLKRGGYTKAALKLFKVIEFSIEASDNQSRPKPPEFTGAPIIEEPRNDRSLKTLPESH